jgi:hypothetical protein
LSQKPVYSFGIPKDQDSYLADLFLPTETFPHRPEAFICYAEAINRPPEELLFHLEAMLFHPEAMFYNPEAMFHHPEDVFPAGKTSSALRKTSSARGNASSAQYIYSSA